MNYVKSGSFYIDQGAYSSGRWESSLRFSRVSYMNGMTMVYDILVSDPIKDSDFKMWLGESTRASAEGCTYPIAIGIFSGRDFKVDNQSFFSSLRNPLKWVPSSSYLYKSSNAIREIIGRIIYGAWK